MKLLKITQKMTKFKAKDLLIEAEKLTNNDRNEQYGSITESFNLYSEICKVNFNLEIEPYQIAQILMAIKLGRQKFKHKDDNLIDLAGYTKILAVLLEDVHDKENLTQGDETTKLYQDGISKILEFLNDYNKKRAENKNLPFVQITINYSKTKSSNFYLKISKEIKQDYWESTFIDLDKLDIIELTSDYLDLSKIKKHSHIGLRYHKGQTYLVHLFKL